MTLPYSVIHYSITTTTQTDISNDIVSIPLCTDTGSGEVNTAIIVLSGDGGRYITSSPIIDQFDQIKITLIDSVNPNYVRIFEVRKIIPQETKDSGTRLEIHMVGVEANLQVIDYITPWYFTDAYTVVNDIANYYNSQTLTTNQPFCINNTTSNKLPTWTTNTYDFGLNEDKCYNRINEVVDKLGASVDAGGVLDFFDVGFTCNAFNSMTMNIFSSGSKPASPITISNTNAVNIGETKGGIDSQTGTIVCSWGANGMGSLPTDYSKYQSKQIIYPLYKQWDITVSYPQNARVQWKGSVYLALSDNQATQPDTHPATWQLRTQALEYGNVIQYSPWTVGKLSSWRNSGSNLSNIPAVDGTAPFFLGCWDGNLVLNNDQTVFRYPVDCNATSPDIVTGSATLRKFLYNDQNFYRGFRVLCLGNPTAMSNGTYFGYSSGTAGTAKDVNGNLIANSIMEYNGTQWIVKYNASTNMMISNIYEGMVYQYDTTIPGAWGTIGAFGKGNDCFHPYDLLSQVPGIVTDGTFGTNLNSGIQAKYEWLLQPPIGYTDTNDNYYMMGAWLNFRFPFPHNNINATGLNVGQLYGGNIISLQEPATLDTQNMHYTHDGNRGFNNTSAEDYGPLSSHDFIMTLGYYDSLLNTLIPGEANFKMRCLMFDTEDNCVYQDFTIPFNNVPQAVSLPLSGFDIYRGLQPLWGPADVLVPPVQASPTNVFNWRNLKQICYQTQESYDSSGRYNPIYSRYNSILVASTLGRYILLTIDAFRFSKPLFVTSGVVSQRIIQPDFLQRPNILFYDQLKNDALTELQKAQFRHKEYDITTTLALDINFGDSFYFSNPRIVSDSDNGSNTIKLVAKRIEYSVTKADNGQGGILRTISGIKRFT